MFNGRIPMPALAEAYGLKAEECIELAPMVKATFKELTQVTPGIINEAAETFAEGSFNKWKEEYSNLRVIVSIADKKWPTCGDGFLSKILDTVLSIKEDRIHAVGFLKIIWQTIILTDMEVDRNLAVSILQSDGFRLKKEVHGLSQSIVDSIGNESIHTAGQDNPISGKDIQGGSPIGEHTAQLAAQVSELKARVADLRAKLADAEARAAKVDGHGLCTAVIRMRAEGRSEKEIFDRLDSLGLNDSQKSVLLFRKEKSTNSARVKNIQRIKGTAKRSF